MDNNIAEAMKLLDNIQREAAKKDEALNIATQAMKKSQEKVTEMVVLIRGTSDRTESEKQILRKLYGITNILSKAGEVIQFTY